jgi:hypothetical protein
VRESPLCEVRRIRVQSDSSKGDVVAVVEYDAKPKVEDKRCARCVDDQVAGVCNHERHVRKDVPAFVGCGDVRGSGGESWWWFWPVEWSVQTARRPGMYSHKQTPVDQRVARAQQANQQIVTKTGIAP